MFSDKIIVMLPSGNVAFSIDKWLFDADTDLRQEAKDVIRLLVKRYPEAALSRWEIDDLGEVTHTEPYTI